MGKRVDVDHLVNAAQIADRLGLRDGQVVRNWRGRAREFPEPVVDRDRLTLWEWPAVERWARKAGRLPG